MVAEAPYPEVFGGDGPRRDVGAPPQATLAPAVDAARAQPRWCGSRARRATRSRTAPASSSRRRLVVTNAHVVAGERRHLRVPARRSDRLDARVVRFDPRRDLAVLARRRTSGSTPLRARRRRRRATWARSTAIPVVARCAPTPARDRRADRRARHRHLPDDTHPPGRVRARGAARAGRLRRAARRPGRQRHRRRVRDRPRPRGHRVRAHQRRAARRCSTSIPDDTVETGSCLVG